MNGQPEPPPTPSPRGVAQVGERRFREPEAAGSIPVTPTTMKTRREVLGALAALAPAIGAVAALGVQRRAAEPEPMDSPKELRIFKLGDVSSHDQRQLEDLLHRLKVDPYAAIIMHPMSVEYVPAR